MLEYTGRTQVSAGNTISVPLLNVTADPCMVEFDHELIDAEFGISTTQLGELELTVVTTEEVEEARLPLPTSKARVPKKTALEAFIFFFSDSKTYILLSEPDVRKAQQGGS
jgi:hypothetical protein